MNSPFPSQTAVRPAAVDPIRCTKCRLRAANQHNIDCLNKETVCGTGRTRYKADVMAELKIFFCARRENARALFIFECERAVATVCLSSAHTTQKESAKLTQKRNLRRLHHQERARAIIMELPQQRTDGEEFGPQPKIISHFPKLILKNVSFREDFWAPSGGEKCKSLY